MSTPILRYFELVGFEDVSARPLGCPGHVVGREAQSPPEPSDIEGERLWTEGNSGTNEVNLQRTLAMGVGENLRLLMSVADVPEGYELEFMLREVGDGTGGAMDIVAQFRHGGGRAAKRLLILVDCKNPRPATRATLLDQLVRAQLLAIPVLSNLVVGGPQAELEVRLIALVGINPGLSLGTAERVASPPRWSNGRARVVVPRPRIVGFLPVRARGRTYFVHGPWPTPTTSAWGDHWVKSALEANRKARTNGRKRPIARSIRPTWFDRAMGGGEGIAVSCPDAAEYHAAIRDLASARSSPATRLIRAMRESSASGVLPADWQYLGETLDKGKSRLFWRTRSATCDDVLLRELVRFFEERALVHAPEE